MRTFLFALIFIFIYIPSNSQDIIIKKDSTAMKAKVKKIRMDVNLNVSLDLLHDRIDTLAARIAILESSQIINTNSIIEIKPTIEIRSFSLDETKDLLIEYFGNFVSVESANKSEGYIRNPYNATFEEDFIRLSFYECTGQQAKNWFAKSDPCGARKLNSNLFNFSNFYGIDIDKRGQGLAYLNIWVDITKNERKGTWEKYKLTIQVDGHDNAKLLNDALKHYNQLMLEKKSLLQSNY